MQLANRIAPVPLWLLWPFGVLPAQVAATAPVSVFVADRASSAPACPGARRVSSSRPFAPNRSIRPRLFPDNEVGCRSNQGVEDRPSAHRAGHNPGGSSADAIEVSVAMRDLAVPLRTGYGQGDREANLFRFV